MSTSPAVARRGSPSARPADHQRGGLLRTRFAWWRSRRRRERDLNRPLRIPVALGRHRFPGTDVESELYEALDAYDRPFALMLVPSTGHASLVVSLEPAGGDVLDAAGAEGWIADLGVWLALLVHEPHLAGCAVSIAHDPGAAAPLEIIAQLTWRTRGPQGRTDAAALAAELGARLPDVADGLCRCQVGTANPLSAADLLGIVGRAYVPDHLSGRPSTWQQAAPREPDEGWGRLHHDGATSVTWCLSDVPPAVVLGGVLAQLTAAQGEGRQFLARTRVTLLYRPDAEPAPDVVRDETGLPPDALAPRAIGAGPPELTCLVTVSVTGGASELDEAVQTVLTGIAPSLRPWLRPLYGSQAAAFAAAVPSGTLLGTHTAAPALLRETTG